MNLVVDTNRVIAALLKDSSSRKTIKNVDYAFITPDFSLEEINKYKTVLCKKSGLTEEDFDILLTLIFSTIEIIPKSDYKDFIGEAEKLIGERDAKDIPFLALAIAKKVDGIWSDDKDFLVQSRIKIYKTVDLI